MPNARPLAPTVLARGARGAVVAPHHLATEAGIGVLRAGGSAVDAAIATNAALAVVAGYACGIGGDAFWLIWDPAAARLAALNGSGRAPAAADPTALRRSGLVRLPRRGPLAITVPGAVRSWADAHRRFGRLPIARLLAPAIELAAEGFPADDVFIRSVELGSARFEAELADGAAGFRATYRPADRPWRPGERVPLPALAATLERLVAAGLDDLYDGALAAGQARGLAAAGSSITAADLAAHRSTWTEPISIGYRNATVATHPPNSSGVVALEILNVLDRFEPPSRSRGDDSDPIADGPWLHVLIEAAKLALADRDAFLTDPEAREVPVARLLDPAHGAELAARIDARRAAEPPAATVPRGGGTVALSTVDAAGMAVSLIESNYQGFGSGVVDPATGIAYQNRGSYFSLDPDHPNVLAPGKRTLHTLLPWMLLRDGRPWVVGGSMGGDAQPAICAEVVSRLVDGGLDVAAAVGGPRAFPEPADHFEPPDRVTLEPRFGAEVLDDLAGRGHRLAVTAPFDSALGHCHAIELVEGGPAEGGSLAAATDPRSIGLPAAW